MRHPQADTAYGTRLRRTRYAVRDWWRVRQYDRAIKQVARYGWHSADLMLPRVLEAVSETYLSRPPAVSFAVLRRHEDAGLDEVSARAEVRRRWQTLKDLATDILDEDTADAVLNSDQFAELQRHFYQHLAEMSADGLLWD